MYKCNAILSLQASFVRLIRHKLIKICSQIPVSIRGYDFFSLKILTKCHWEELKR